MTEKKKRSSPFLIEKNGEVGSSKSSRLMASPGRQPKPTGHQVIEGHNFVTFARVFVFVYITFPIHRMMFICMYVYTYIHIYIYIYTGIYIYIHIMDK